MTNALPPFDVLYQALCDRDPSYEGRAYVGVTSTGIFCRLTCPARKPLARNCQFHASVAECIKAGFRPCKRCHPLAPEAAGDPVVTRLLAALDQRPDHRWCEADISALGLDPSTARRAFQRHYGISFLDMARHRRLSRGFTTLSQGGRVIEAQMDAGYASPSAFRDGFARLLGVAPGKLAPAALLRADWIDTPLGAMIAVADASALHLLEFADRKALPTELKRLHTRAKGSLGLGRFAPTDQVQAQLERYFNGTDPQFTVPLSLDGSSFTKSVWAHLQTIPAGHTQSYGQIAEALGRPTAARAVARANGANQIALLIPCHRVIGADGALTGYGGGLWRKQRLIALERAYAGAVDTPQERISHAQP